ncbi:hypothetical protein NC796_03735 [Aliifodinibius sp. S!AR15-10]|uniref:hypothetical protein n=1 Tax=Aliifodinibius sp. S!AR15-10 TaxID=2950437 RepID=UPI0028646061|nr:hypothetical protein [Aliifodinibius sp. S!AR15-10]MDR8390238.1 hypothetical protein [Aliifodinibius sp. S!AR15-10]
MRQLFYRLFFLKFSNKKIDHWYYRILSRIINHLYPFIFSLTEKLPSFKIIPDNELNKDDKYIVSLTSFPKRIDKVWITIESILRQTRKPDAIILWLSKVEFPDPNSLPEKLLKLKKRGLIINFCDDNIMPHKKYYYCMKEYSNANIVTIDDDIIYPHTFLENLISYQKKFPESVCCTVARNITTNGKDNLTDYKEWKNVKENTTPSFSLIPIGAGGVLYPPKKLHEDVFDIQVLKQLAIKTDDLWLKIMAIRNYTKTVCCSGKYNRNFVSIIGSQKNNLMESNISGGDNNRVIHDLVDYYNVNMTILN